MRRDAEDRGQGTSRRNSGDPFYRGQIVGDLLRHKKEARLDINPPDINLSKLRRGNLVNLLLPTHPYSAPIDP
jgi:hypothetical protein